MVIVRFTHYLLDKLPSSSVLINTQKNKHLHHRLFPNCVVADIQCIQTHYLIQPYIIRWVYFVPDRKSEQYR